MATKANNPTRPKPQNAKELLIQEWLDENLVKYELDRKYPMSKVDLEASLNNQARLDVPLDENLVENYAEAMENGDEFPPVVGYVKNNKLILIDGNHRAQAHNLRDSETLPVYIVKGASTDMLVRLTYEANAKHPRPNTNEERLQHAMWLVRSGHTQIDAAQVMGVRASELSTAWQRSEADRRANAVGIRRSLWNPLSATKRQRLNSIKSDTVFKKAVDITGKMEIRNDELSQLITRVNHERTNAAQLRVLKEYTDEHPEKVSLGNKPRNMRYLLRTHIHGIRSDLNRDDFFDNLSPQEAEEFSGLLRGLIEEAKQAIKELDSYA